MVQSPYQHSDTVLGVGMDKLVSFASLTVHCQLQNAIKFL